MSWWGDRAPQKETPAPIPAPIDREAEARTKVRLLKASLNALDADMLHFKTKHRVKTDSFGRLLGIESPSMTGYAQIRIEWDALLRRRDRNVAQWHSALKAWSEAKQETSPCLKTNCP